MVLQGAAALMLGSPALAETRQALVIADRALGQEPGQPARDALDMSRALFAAGFDVRRLENPASLPAPAAERPDVMLIYISADLAVDSAAGPAVSLTSGPIALPALSQLYPAARQQIVLIESCPVDAARLAEQDRAAPVLTAPEGAAMLALSPAEGAACGSGGRLTALTLTALAQPGQELSATLREAGSMVVTGPGWPGFTAMAAASPPPGGDGIIIDQALRPVDQISAVSGVSAQTAVQTAAGSGVQIFTAAAPAIPLGGDRAARPTAQGLPEPSIIVGDRPDPQGETVPDSLAGTSVGGSYEERKRIRDDDPALFASLLDSGAFDPPGDQIASVIQTELQRMNCYGGTVDGIWGNGSRQAVDRYFQQAGGAPTTREPQVALFRQIALKDDLRCPAVVVQPAVRNTAATPSRQNGTSATRRQPQQATRQPTRQPARQPAAQPPAASTGTPRINPNTLGTGVFR